MFQVQSNFKGATISRSIRFTPQLFDHLNHVAAVHEVSFNLLVLQCCQYALDMLEEDNKDQQ